jgi:hypothetical protein
MTRRAGVLARVAVLAVLEAAAFVVAGAAMSSAARAAGGDTAATLVDAMRAARASDGFELRVALTASGPRAGTGTGTGTDTAASPEGAALEPVKVAIVGQADAAGERVLVRGIAPARVRDAVVMASHVDRRVAARAGGAAVDPQAVLFGTGLVAWDLLAPWWDWPDARVTGTAEVGGHACTELRSRAPAAGGEGEAVAEVLSCIDARRGLAWRTRLFDRHHRLLRELVVEREIRTQAGTSAAKLATITSADGRTTRVEVYAGDEHHRIEPGTFAALDDAAARSAR